LPHISSLPHGPQCPTTLWTIGAWWWMFYSSMCFCGRHNSWPIATLPHIQPSRIAPPYPTFSRSPNWPIALNTETCNSHFAYTCFTYKMFPFCLFPILPTPILPIFRLLFNVPPFWDAMMKMMMMKMMNVLLQHDPLCDKHWYELIDPWPMLPPQCCRHRVLVLLYISPWMLSGYQLLTKIQEIPLGSR
jgi:hypothetical protein